MTRHEQAACHEKQVPDHETRRRQFRFHSPQPSPRGKYCHTVQEFEITTLTHIFSSPLDDRHSRWHPPFNRFPLPYRFIRDTVTLAGWDIRRRLRCFLTHSWEIERVVFPTMTKYMRLDYSVRYDDGGLNNDDNAWLTSYQASWVFALVEAISGSDRIGVAIRSLPTRCWSIELHSTQRGIICYQCLFIHIVDNFAASVVELANIINSSSNSSSWLITSRIHMGDCVWGS